MLPYHNVNGTSPLIQCEESYYVDRRFVPFNNILFFLLAMALHCGVQVTCSFQGLRHDSPISTTHIFKKKIKQMFVKTQYRSPFSYYLVWILNLSNIQPCCFSFYIPNLTNLHLYFPNPTHHLFPQFHSISYIPVVFYSPLSCQTCEGNIDCTRSKQTSCLADL